MDQNMDPDMTTINSPSNKTSYLIMTMNKNCEAAEHLALQTVAGLDIPFLNPLRELTKGDCWQILKKHQDIFSILEQALVLSGLTDYISCATQNELFSTFHKKSDRDSLPTLLTHLNSKWVRFFNRLGQYDLTHAQLKSLVFLLRQSLKRLPETYQKSSLSHALAMGESSLKRAQMPPQHNSPVTFTGIMTAHCVKPQKESKTITEKQMTSVNKADVRVLNKKMAVAANKTNKGKQNHCVKLKANVKRGILNKIMAAPVKTTVQGKSVGTVSKTTTHTAKHMLDFVQLMQPLTVVDLTESLKQPVKLLTQKTQTKYTSDITKYILKPQENKFSEREMSNCSKSLNGLLTEGKENQKIWPVSPPAGSDLDTLEEPVTHATPTRKSSAVIDVGSSAKKPQTEEEREVRKTRVNAFELMMKQSRASKGQDVKQRSSLQ